MIIDGRSLPENENIQADICIIGAGASGISLALEFVHTSLNVVMIESGGLSFKHKAQWLYKGENIGRPYYDLEFTKQRYFGGASNKWFGRCRPLDPIDFEERSWVPHSGWPFGKDEMDPYYVRAHSVCQLGPYNYDTEYWSSASKKPLPLTGTGIETKIFQFSPPTRFGRQYQSAIKRAENIKTFLFSNATFISLDPDGQTAGHVTCATFGGRKFKVSAKIFILAASAIEIPRLLLFSNNIQQHGIGNEHDLVGRFFMEHPHIFCGIITSPLAAAHLGFHNVLDYNSDKGNLGTVGALGCTEDIMRQEKLLNAAAFFVKRKNYKVENCYFSKAAMAWTHVIDVLNHTKAPGLNFFQDLKFALKNVDIAGRMTLQRLKEIGRPVSWIAIRAQLETVPNPDSRVTLSEKKDRLGMRKVKLDWRLTRQDLESFQKFQQNLFDGLRQNGCTIRPFPHELDETGWPVAMLAGKHHMGTTRIHTDPRKGVVDANCRIHGVSNVYIAGSSVFPTSGQANPMLTLVALAIRLADHIKERFAESGSPK